MHYYYWWPIIIIMYFFIITLPKHNTTMNNYHLLHTALVKAVGIMYIEVIFGIHTNIIQGAHYTPGSNYI